MFESSHPAPTILPLTAHDGPIATTSITSSAARQRRVTRRSPGREDRRQATPRRQGSTMNPQQPYQQGPAERLAVGTGRTVHAELLTANRATAVAHRFLRDRRTKRQQLAVVVGVIVALILILIIQPRVSRGPTSSPAIIRDLVELVRVNSAARRSNAQRAAAPTAITLAAPPSDLRLVAGRAQHRQGAGRTRRRSRSSFTASVTAVRSSRQAGRTAFRCRRATRRRQHLRSELRTSSTRPTQDAGPDGRVGSRTATGTSYKDDLFKAEVVVAGSSAERDHARAGLDDRCRG